MMLDDIFERVARAAEFSGRSFSDITIVAATKTVDILRIAPIVQAGVTNLGENRVQELMDKYGGVPNACWHMIGHLQKNKVKYIIDKVNLIHSVDNFELAKEIDRQASKYNKVQDILVQVNISGEESKFGVAEQNCRELIEQISTLKNVRTCGLMTIPPLAASEQYVRELYSKCNSILIDIREQQLDNVSMHQLSMGMSGDFEIAIQEGANIVRIGSGIFGARQAT